MQTKETRPLSIDQALLNIQYWPRQIWFNLKCSQLILRKILLPLDKCISGCTWKGFWFSSLAWNLTPHMRTRAFAAPVRVTVPSSTVHAHRLGYKGHIYTPCSRTNFDTFYCQRVNSGNLLSWRSQRRKKQVKRILAEIYWMEKIRV